MVVPDQDDGALAALAELARRELDGAPPRRARARYEDLERRRLARVRPRRWVVATALAAVIGALASWVVEGSSEPVAVAPARHPAPEPALSMEVTEGTVESSGDLNASRGALVRFSDGTRVQVDADARVRVESVTARGAELRLSGGRMRLDVVKRPQAKWSVWAGEYRIRVTGTSFAVNLDDGESLSVEMMEGEVQVTGPLSPEGLALHAGQRLDVSPRRGDLVVGDVELALDAPEASVPESPESPDSQARATPGDSVARARRKRARGPLEAAEPAAFDESWKRRVASGRWSEVIDEARKRGLSNVHEQASLEGLSALADAARYARRFGVARGALSAVRRRFPERPAAARSAFFLGRLEEGRGAVEQALAWYDRYLLEEPRGPYAAQALGRKLSLLVHRGGAGADAVAREYLRHFPDGAHAGEARRRLERRGPGSP